MPSTPTPPAPAPAELPKGTPSWLSHLVALVLVGVAAGLDAWQPNHTLSTPTVQGVVLVAAFAVAGLIHITRLAHENGISAAGWAKTVGEEESWLKANLGDLKGLVAQVKAGAATTPEGVKLEADVATAAKKVTAAADKLSPEDRASLSAALAGITA